MAKYQKQLTPTLKTTVTVINDRVVCNVNGIISWDLPLEKTRFRTLEGLNRCLIQAGYKLA